FGFPLIFMTCPKHLSIFNGLGRAYRGYSQKFAGKIAFKIGQFYSFTVLSSIQIYLHLVQ
ncbi:MAG: hypothetical protein KAR64_06485, partial [Thermoplasmatales archaeon]|nr:hypothetical protein [Thermoplasmatales archaeon]